jgi:hypothetical protein
MVVVQRTLREIDAGHAPDTAAATDKPGSSHQAHSSLTQQLGPRPPETAQAADCDRRRHHRLGLDDLTVAHRLHVAARGGGKTAAPPAIGPPTAVTQSKRPRSSGTRYRSRMACWGCSRSGVPGSDRRETMAARVGLASCDRPLWRRTNRALRPTSCARSRRLGSHRLVRRRRQLAAVDVEHPQRAVGLDKPG